MMRSKDLTEKPKTVTKQTNSSLRKASVVVPTHPSSSPKWSVYTRTGEADADKRRCKAPPSRQMRSKTLVTRIQAVALLILLCASPSHATWLFGKHNEFGPITKFLRFVKKTTGAGQMVNPKERILDLLRAASETCGKQKKARNMILDMLEKRVDALSESMVAGTIKPEEIAKIQEGWYENVVTKYAEIPLLESQRMRAVLRNTFTLRSMSDCLEKTTLTKYFHAIVKDAIEKKTAFRMQSVHQRILKYWPTKERETIVSDVAVMLVAVGQSLSRGCPTDVDLDNFLTLHKEYRTIPWVERDHLNLVEGASHPVTSMKRWRSDTVREMDVFLSSDSVTKLGRHKTKAALWDDYLQTAAICKKRYRGWRKTQSHPTTDAINEFLTSKFPYMNIPNFWNKAYAKWESKLPKTPIAKPGTSRTRRSRSPRPHTRSRPRQGRPRRRSSGSPRVRKKQPCAES